MVEDDASGASGVSGVSPHCTFFPLSTLSVGDSSESPELLVVSGRALYVDGLSSDPNVLDLSLYSCAAGVGGSYSGCCGSSMSQYPVPLRYGLMRSSLAVHQLSVDAM